MIVVVGPSGAGKDSVIREAWPALEELGNIRLVKRVVTRPADPDRENHYSISKDEFKEKSQQGDFSVEWTAHNLNYGIPVNTLQNIHNGDTLIANGSRAAVPDFRKAYPRCLIIWITAPVDVLAARLVARKTESIDEITDRLKRSIPIKPAKSDVVISNDKSLAHSAELFASAVLAVHKSPRKGLTG